MEAIYGPQGRVVAWLEANEIVRNLDGQVIGWLYEDAVYGLQGQHVGYFNDGNFRDHRGAAVAFVSGAKGGPTRPVRHARPTQPVRAVRPARAARSARQARAARVGVWSNLSFFQYLPR
ncbi:4-fold beta flower protein [Arthrobacter sp. D2-10]